MNTTQQYVINTYYSWIKDLVSNYTGEPPLQGFRHISYFSIVDGLRIDTVKHVQKPFWPGFNTAAGVYCVGEVADGDSA